MIRWSRHRALLAWILIAASLPGCAHKKKPQEPPPIVEVAHPLQAQVRDWDEVVGRFLSIQSVDIRPRVAGYVTKVTFQDGQDVKRGQLLFVIDPRPYQAALDRARAAVQRQRATLANAQLELTRAGNLILAKAASDQEYQTRVVAAQQAAADLATARADEEQAALNIGFTRVRAAVAGRTSDRRVNPGNLVTADQTSLTSIVTLDPIRFEFTAPESLFLKYDRSGGRGALGAPVEVRLQNERSFQHQGRIEFIDNQVSSTAGTIRGRAIIPNADRKIAPGLFGQMRIAGQQPHAALLVPDGVVRHDQDREIVDIVTPQGVVKEQKVETGALVGGLRVVLKGLDPRSEVIVAGRQKAKPGQKIHARQGRLAPPRENRTEPEQDYDAPIADTAIVVGR